MPKPKTQAKAATRGRGRPPEVKKDAGPPLKRRKLEPLIFQSHPLDSIIENLRKFKWDKRVDFDIVTETLDQIALEGLSGITFERLLCMLDAVSPNLNCIKDCNAQTYIWTVIMRLLARPQGSGVRAYCFPSPSSNKQALELSEDKSSNKGILLDKEIKLPKDTLARISKQECSLFAVQDGHIMGSCQHYLNRHDVTDDLKRISSEFQDSLEAMHKVNDIYDLKNITFVADQEVRRKAILPDWSDPNVDIKMREYACLEFIGKTRTLGVVFPNDKALGRYRILLTAKKFISQYQPKCTSHIVHHLIRFSKYRTDQPDDSKIYKGAPTRTVDDLEVEEKFEDDDVDSELLTAKKACCVPRRLRFDSDMLKMVYYIIAHSRGRSPLDIRRKLRLPKYHVRNHIKNLANIELIGSHTRKIVDQMFRIYRARHKSMVFMKRLREKLNRVKLRGSGKIKFDEIDLRAKSILGHRRSQFTQAEDSLLILCRICCLLIEPNLTKKVSFCVHKRFIRDLLHDELCESHDKTADACLRRIKYLRNLPNNIMSINELTAELRDDPDITRLLSSRATAKTEEKLTRLFNQILKVVRAKLPQLLGINSGGASETLVAQRHSIKIRNFNDLNDRYELIDCQATSSNRCRSHPGTTILQLAQPIEHNYKLDLSECDEMFSIALLSSVCTHVTFDIELKLKVPLVIVGLDQGNESYKQLCAKAKDTTRELLNNLSSPSLAADSRRALFMLRNELKTQALDKCGNLADALIVQPCNVRFSSDRMIAYDQRHLFPAGRKLLKNVELILSWIFVMPGIEFETLLLKVIHATHTRENLIELLELMKQSDLISEQLLRHEQTRTGIVKVPSKEAPILVYEPQPDAYIKFAQLLKL